MAQIVTRKFLKLHLEVAAQAIIQKSIQAPSREHLSAFLKAITGRIAQLVGGTKGFWDARPFSRMVSWGRDFKNVARYVGMNSTEMPGFRATRCGPCLIQFNARYGRGFWAKSLGLVAAGFT